MKFEDFLLEYGIVPENKRFYEEALTHNSFANENRIKYSYQRMEFLGDAILQMYVSLYFFQNNPSLKEGKLTKMRSVLVREEALAMVAKEIGLGSIIRLGQGEINSKGFEKDSILADVFEAITAAIYMDKGETIMKEWLQKTIFNFVGKEKFKDISSDYKSELQELLQAENRNNLKYVVEEQNFLGDENKIEYTVSVYLDDQKFGTGQGNSKQEAEKQAAKDCLSKLITTKNNDKFDII